ncbi:hypothetical protein [Butyrivibrio fibrisolvens]|uniref:hypothetical protein n=1 Tax=Butyrivibrio fibrisolvens TaxID=831 RepID=UPI0020BDC2FA|nr:hypothetical protein [Butyrivibrio fibrisolvens]
MQFEELGNMSGKTLMLLPGTCCDYQTNFGTVLDELSKSITLSASTMTVLMEAVLFFRI